MTATQPLIFAENETKEIAPTDILKKLPQRVTFNLRNRHTIKLAEFSRHVNNLISENITKSTLVEMNTIRSAVEVFRSIIASDNLFFLSSSVDPKT